MAKMKVFEVKNLINEKNHGNIESKDIQNFLEKNLGVKKTHSSNLEDHEVKAVKEHFVPSAKKTSETPATNKMRSATAPANQGQGMVRPDGAGQTRPQGMARPDGQGQTRPQGQGVRPDGQDQGMRSEGQSQRGQQGMRPTQTYHAGGSRSQGQGTRPDGSDQRRPYGNTRPDGAGQGTRPDSSDQRRPYGNTRPDGAGQGTRPDSSGQRRPYGNTRPDGTGQGMRPDGSGQRGQQGMRPDGYSQRGQQGGQQGMRQDGYGQRGQQGMRPDGSGQRGPQGTRQDGYGQRGPQGTRQDGQGQAPRGQRPPQGGQQGNQYQGTRPDWQNRDTRQTGQTGQGTTRPSGSGQGRTDWSSQGRPQQNRPYGSNTGRPDGTGQRGPQGQGRPYQGDRTARPADQQGARQGSYQDNRRTPDQGRYRSDGQQGAARPYNSNTGARGQGQGQSQSQRPYNSQGNYQRPQGSQGGGQRGGYNPRGFEGGFNKDEDDKPAYGNRSNAGKRGTGPQRGSDRKDFDQKILDQKVAEKNDNRRNRDRMNKDKQYKDKTVAQRDIDDMNSKAPKKGQFIKPKPIVVVKEEIKVITIPEVLTIKELADKMKIPSAALIKKLFLAGRVVTINQEMTFEEAEEIALGYDIISEKEIPVNEVEELLKEEDEDEADMVKRPPVVCVMGHVDHGKTSLLDAIRHANVTSREAGGITQHIGAYIAKINGEKITFLDTPGHEAFTSMRMRGAQATDIAILVVAADDGVMPQTVEAISHAKAAGVKIIVAINKIDKPSANVERVKQELTEYELVAEDWGGDTIFVPVSAHTKEGIEQLLEMILLTAEIEELKANPNRTARGLVIEAELDKGRGPVATILVQKGTLRVGDNIVVGSSYGKVRAMIDDKGDRAEEAGPSTPVEILGLNTVPDVGEIFMATDNEKEARTISEAFITQGKEKLLSDTKAKLSLDGLFTQIQAGNIKELNLIIKADVQGSVEAMKQSLLKLSNEEVAVRIIHGGVGAINESDVILASTSNGIIIGFNVKPDNRAKEIAEYENVDVKLYRVIYNAINDVEAAMKGLLDPVYEEKITGHAEVRQIFKASSLGNIAGSYVLDGKVTRGNKLRIYRGNELIHEGNLASLKRFQDDVKEVAAGYECGLVFEKFNDIKEEDKVEFYVMVEVPR